MSDDPLDSLTPAERRAVALRVAGFTERESAYALGVTPGTVRSYVHRAGRVTGLRTIPLCLAWARRYDACIHRLVHKGP